jgi:hypothetical protein
LFCKENEGTLYFCKSKDEPLNKYLCDKPKGLIEVYENLDELPPIKDLKPCNQTLICFNDMVTDIRKHPIIS